MDADSDYNRLCSDVYKRQIILRRVYTCILFIWCIGITMLEQFGGNTIGVYCYLIPTIAALLLMEPLESILFFSINWGVVVVLLVVSGVNQENLFGNIINGTFVTFLSVFISIRYNRSVEAEFRDREIISMQYKKIQKANDKLHEMAFTDQLTGLHNRRCTALKQYTDVTFEGNVTISSKLEIPAGSTLNVKGDLTANAAIVRCV